MEAVSGSYELLLSVVIAVHRTTHPFLHSPPLSIVIPVRTAPAPHPHQHSSEFGTDKIWVFCDVPYSSVSLPWHACQKTREPGAPTRLPPTEIASATTARPRPAVVVVAVAVMTLRLSCLTCVAVIVVLVEK